MPDPWVELYRIAGLVRAALDTQGSNFIWSSWTGRKEALIEMDEVLAGLGAKNEESANLLHMLLLPTGPICEVACSSGWPDKWDELAGQCNDVIEGLGSSSTDS